MKFVSKADLYGDPGYWRLRQFCPQHDPNFIGVDIADEFNPKPVMAHEVKAKVQEQKKAPSPVSLVAVVESASEEEPDPSTLSWRELRSACIERNINTHGRKRKELEAALRGL